MHQGMSRVSSNEDGSFRFITLYGRDPRYGNQMKYTFLFHKKVVLVGGHHEHNYALLEDGKLLIWKETGNSHHYPIDVDGYIFDATDPMVIELHKAIFEDADRMLLT